MEQRNEPSTAEIVRALRDEAMFELAGQAAMVHLPVLQSAISRLEQLERELDESYQADCDTKGLLDVAVARAESAEATLKVLEPFVVKKCVTCFYHDCINEEEPCFFCTKAAGASLEHPKWEYRGLPQKGEGK